jgi:hypothetical protein
VKLTPQTFATALDNTDNAFILIYAEWCGNCKTYKPIHESLGKQMHEGYHANKDTCLPIVIAEIDGSAHAKEVERILGERNLPKPEGFPTILMKRSDQGKRVVEQYKGNRDRESITRALRDFLASSSACDLGKVVPGAPNPDYWILYDSRATSATSDQVCRTLKESREVALHGQIIDVSKPMSAQFRDLLQKRPNLRLPAVVNRQGDVAEGPAVVKYFSSFVA